MRIVFSIIFIVTISCLNIYAKEVKDGISIVDIGLDVGAFNSVQFMDTGNVKSSFSVIPYGKLSLRFLNGYPFIPQIEIENTGFFRFDKQMMSTKKITSGYNSYYVRVPLMLSIPFATYRSMLNIDTRYTTYAKKYTLQRDIYVNGTNSASGSDVYGVTSESETRLYFQTPIRSNESRFNHAFIGIYYSEDVAPRSTSGISVTENKPNFINVVVRNFGIFYELKTDTPAKGLNFLINVMLGYGNTYLLNDSLPYDRDVFANVNNLIMIKGRAGLSYRYMFNPHIGLGVDLKIEYTSANDFLGDSGGANKTTIDMYGELRSKLSFTIITGY